MNIPSSDHHISASFQSPDVMYKHVENTTKHPNDPASQAVPTFKTYEEACTTHMENPERVQYEKCQVVCTLRKSRIIELHLTVQLRQLVS